MLRLDLYSINTRHVGSAGYILCLFETRRLSWISKVFMRDIYAQLDLYIVFARPVGSVGYL